MKICAIGLRGIPDVIGGIETHCEQLYSHLSELDDTLEIVVIGRSGYARKQKIGSIRVVPLWAPGHCHLAGPSVSSGLGFTLYSVSLPRIRP